MFRNSAVDSNGKYHSVQKITGHKQMFGITLSTLNGYTYNSSFKIRN